MQSLPLCVETLVSPACGLSFFCGYPLYASVYRQKRRKEEGRRIALLLFHARLRLMHRGALL